MIIYRPQRGFIYESMKEAKEFETIDDMKHHIVSEWNHGGDVLFTEDDIEISDESVNDERIKWRDLRYVCIKRIGDTNYVEKYDCASCIGFCATDYDKIDIETLSKP